MKYAILILAVVLVMMVTPSLTQDDSYDSYNRSSYNRPEYMYNGANNYHHNGMAAFLSLGFILSITFMLQRF